MSARFWAKKVKVTSRPAQGVVCDGEMLGKMAVHAKVIPQAVNILVPDTVPAEKFP